ncbi:MAG: hypothetical protein KJ905_00920 [Nanoarchaeota archaeon]|nr:hypothetical protein [Nanoarchaeota archaeon]MBU1501321.1 hypothetical protein [Nanoarchaeota archaeon]MBU2459432.1 hypothetical protein [Nanoarchaeota archaeon]
MDISLSGILTNLKQKFDKIKNLRSPSAHSEGHQVSPYTTPSFNLRSPSAHGINGFETAFGQVSPQGKNIKQKSSSKVNLLLKKSECSDGKIVNYTLADLSYSLQETVFAMLVETAERALAHTGKEELLLGGGVACNSRLQEMCRIMCKERGAKFFCPERSLLVDNAAMIAFLGEIIFKMRRNGRARPPAQDLADLDIKPRQRTDDVEVDWR